MTISDGEILLRKMDNNLEWAKEFVKKLENNDVHYFNEIIKFYKEQREKLNTKIIIARSETKIDF